MMASESPGNNNNTCNGLNNSSSSNSNSYSTMTLKLIQRGRKSLTVLHFFFYSGVACLVPFLSTHMQEIGITTSQAAWINSISGLISLIGPLLTVPVAYKYHKYQTLMVFTGLLSAFFYTSLLFVPKVIRTPKHPTLHYDCSENQLRIEQCPDWEGDCSGFPRKLSLSNFTNFTLTKCRYHCGDNGTLTTPVYPLHVCFTSSSRGNLCLVDNSLHEAEIEPPASLKANIEEESDTIQKKASIIQFISRFDRWPVLQSVDHKVNNKNLKMCVYQPAPPLIVDTNSYESIACRPVAHNCRIQCLVNMFFKPHGASEWAPRSPLPCYGLQGNVQATFYSYLILRCLADLSLFALFALTETLPMTLKNNFDNLYGGLARVVSTALPLAIWSVVTGFLIDYYSELSKAPDYAPPFILFDGMILVMSALVIALPVYPITVPLPNVQSVTSLRSYSSNRRIDDMGSNSSERISFKSKCAIAFLMIPVTLVLGTQWGILETFLHPFYLQMNQSKFWIGLTFTITFVTFMPFALLVKSLTSAVGRAHLIALGFVFYSLRLSGISLLSNPRWTLIPFEAMEVFTLPIAWIGLTSYCHDLIQRNSRSVEMMKSGTSSNTFTHIKLQLILLIVHFGLGRALGSFLWGIWDIRWIEDNHFWQWLNEDQALLFDFQTEDFRVFLRLLAIIAAAFALIFCIIYHMCCSNNRKWEKSKLKNSKGHPQRGNQTVMLVNGNIQYSRLNNKSSNSSNHNNHISTNGSKKLTNGETNIKMIDE